MRNKNRKVDIVYNKNRRNQEMNHSKNIIK